MKIILDMETTTAADVLPLIFLLEHPEVEIKAVLIQPGSMEQVQLVRHLCSLAGQPDVRIGTVDADSQNGQIDYHLYKTFPEAFKEPDIDSEPYNTVLLEECVEGSGVTLLVTHSLIPLLALTRINPEERLRLSLVCCEQSWHTLSLCSAPSGTFTEIRIVGSEAHWDTTFQASWKGSALMATVMHSVLESRPGGYNIGTLAAACCAVRPEAVSWKGITLEALPRGRVSFVDGSDFQYTRGDGALSVLSQMEPWVQLPSDIRGWYVPGGYVGPVTIVFQNGDSVDVRWLTGPGMGQVEPVDREYLKAGPLKPQH